MDYSELQEQTWIQLNDEYYFVNDVRDEYCELIKSIPEYKTLKKIQFPAPNIHVIEPNKYNIGTRVLYVGEYEIFANQLGVIRYIDHEDTRLTYGILFDDAAHENDELWVSAFDILPINY